MHNHPGVRVDDGTDFDFDNVEDVRVFLQVDDNITLTRSLGFDSEDSSFLLGHINHLGVEHPFHDLDVDAEWKLPTVLVQEVNLQKGLSIILQLKRANKQIS